MAVVALAMAGTVDEGVMGRVEASLVAALGVSCRRLAPWADPGYAYDEARRQYSSTLIMRDALPRVPVDADKLLVLTERDLFIPMLSFVFGQAQLDGPVALLSLARLRQEFYGLQPNRTLLWTRAGKEALHEMGHAFGVTHCAEMACAMALSTNSRQLDLKGGEYCSSCAILLREAAGLHHAAAARDGSVRGKP